MKKQLTELRRLCKRMLAYLDLSLSGVEELQSHFDRDGNVKPSSSVQDRKP